MKNHAAKNFHLETISCCENELGCKQQQWFWLKIMLATNCEGDESWTLSNFKHFSKQNEKISTLYNATCVLIVFFFFILFFFILWLGTFFSQKITSSRKHQNSIINRRVPDKHHKGLAHDKSPFSTLITHFHWHSLKNMNRRGCCRNFK